ncbi:TPA: hypothetical protein ACJIK4_003585 [Kluyvera cryocrescens]
MKRSIVAFIVLSVVSASCVAGQFDDAEKSADTARAIASKADSMKAHAVSAFNDKNGPQITAGQFLGAVKADDTAHKNLTNAENNVSGTALRNQITEQQHSIVTSTPGIVVTKNPPFAGQHWGNAHGTNNGSHDHSGTGNGSNNAANSNSSHGLGGGDHIGGGRSGGGYHY